MKLKAPPGVGDPSVAGVTIVPRDGLYEVEASVGAVLIESFGFREVALPPRRRSTAATRRGRAAGGSPVVKPKA